MVVQHLGAFQQVVSEIWMQAEVVSVAYVLLRGVWKQIHYFSLYFDELTLGWSAKSNAAFLDLLLMNLLS